VAVTPAGRPVSERVTASVKPFVGETVTESEREEPPACSERDPGALLREKSGVAPAVTERAAVALRLMLPAVPVTVIDAGAVEAEVEALNWN
jgi:hypothetical protein